MIGGDFNVIRDAKDRKSGVIYHKKSKEIIDNFINAEGYSDIWRTQHPDKLFFTHMSRDYRTWSRIDYFLVSNSLEPMCDCTGITPSVNTDHSLISLEFNCSENKRGPGIWKFNNKVLEDKRFIDELNNMLEQYNNMYQHLEHTDFWELMKFEITQFSRNYAAKVAHTKKENKFKLYIKLGGMQSELICDDIPDPQLVNNMNLVRAEIQAFEIKDAKQSAFRCKVNWTKDGEKMSSYYFNLEKRNYNSKTMRFAYKNDGSLTKDYRELLDVQYEFYNELYSANDKVKFNLINEGDVMLCRFERQNGNRHHN